ncbi:MAG: fatty acid desaturase [Burkholderiales bacterium]|nr:fatty acid desaturase [Burkholderiales bacterium]
MAPHNDPHDALAAGTGLEAPVARGEEFRDRNPRRLLTGAELAQFTRLSDWRSAAAIARTLALIAATAGAGLAGFALVRGGSPAAGLALVALAVVLTGCWQHALAILSHEATHYRLFADRAANDLVGRIAGMLIGVSTFSYRIVHRVHHNNLYEAIDPDLALMAGYPRGRLYLVKKLLKDAAGLTAWRNYLYFFGAPAMNAATGTARRPLDDTTERLRRQALADRWVVVAFHAALPLASWAAGVLPEYLVLWVLPALTVQAVLLRLRAVAEHGAPAHVRSPFGAARTNVDLPLWARIALFPHHVNYHLEHHLYPAVPHYNLPALHARLRAAGALDGAEVRPFAQTMRRVFAARGAPPEGADAAPAA